jgi:hypothetical protein
MNRHSLLISERILERGEKNRRREIHHRFTASMDYGPPLSPPSDRKGKEGDPKEKDEIT